jgi:hypothetical protein
VVKAMTYDFPVGDLGFLMELIVEPVARQFRLIGAGCHDERERPDAR